MAKQQRRPPKSSPGPVGGGKGRQPQPERPVSAPQPSRPIAAAPGSPVRRSTYFEAVAVYERALAALQRHDFAEATALLESVLRQFPDEKELHERVRLYLNICQRQASRREVAPQTLEDRLFASTIALNGGRYDEAIQLLRLVRDEDPDNDHALYMLAVAHAQRGEHAAAIAHLERAIALNPENRALARTDPDLDPLRDDEAFLTALDTAAAPNQPPRRPIRTRTAR
jgi:tetratricopeptide (TPR) repeat protein